MSMKVVRFSLSFVGHVDKEDSLSSLTSPPCPTGTSSLVQFARTTASLSRLPVHEAIRASVSSPHIRPDFLSFGLSVAESVDGVRSSS
jgi:hypothetical protein